MDFFEIRENAMSKSENEINISLLITPQCNFFCDHCMYSSSKDEPAEYISDKLLQQLVNSIHDAEQASDYASVTINLVGGEPTLNLNEFERVWNFLSGRDYRLEMTTNGWWLHRESTAVRFFNIIASETYDPEFLSIRISNTDWHRRQRPEWFDEKGRMKLQLDELLEYGLTKETWYCENPECENCGEEIPTEECPSCDEYGSADYTELLDRCINYEDKDEWIYVEEWGDLDAVTPRGRGYLCGGSRSKCCGYHGLTFDYKGNLTDVCCRGSDISTGKIGDDLWMLIALAHDFFDTQEPDCWSCDECVSSWLEEREDFINSMLTVDWYELEEENERTLLHDVSE